MKILSISKNVAVFSNDHSIVFMLVDVFVLVDVLVDELVEVLVDVEVLVFSVL